MRSLPFKAFRNENVPLLPSPSPKTRWWIIGLWGVLCQFAHDTEAWQGTGKCVFWVWSCRGVGPGPVGLSVLRSVDEHKGQSWSLEEPGVGGRSLPMDGPQCPSQT